MPISKEEEDEEKPKCAFTARRKNQRQNSCNIGNGILLWIANTHLHTGSR
jgi:hypothetical protein